MRYTEVPGYVSDLSGYNVIWDAVLFENGYGKNYDELLYSAVCLQTFNIDSVEIPHGGQFINSPE